MKAKEYYEKYKTSIEVPNCHLNEDEVSNSLLKLFDEMHKEMFELVKTRNVKSVPAFKSLVKEFNIKWNCIKRMFEQNGSECAMKTDGFYIAMKDMAQKTGVTI